MEAVKVIDIVITSFNSADTIVPCLRSLEESSHAINKVLIFDDNSSDKTSEIVTTYKKNSSLEISFFSADANSGRPSRGRNLGIMHSESDFLMFLDADDLVYPNYIGISIDFLKNNERTFVGCNVKRFSGKLNFNFKPVVGKFAPVSRVRHSFKNYFSASGLIIPRKLKSRVRFEYHFLEDWLFTMALFEEEGIVGYLLDVPAVAYRCSPGSLSPKGKFKRIQRVFRIHRRKSGILRSLGSLVIYMFLAVHRRFWFDSKLKEGQ